MRALYWLLAAGVVFYAVCETADLAQTLSTRVRRPRAASAAPAVPEIKPSEWRSAPADPSAETAARGKGVLVDKATGKRYEAP